MIVYKVDKQSQSKANTNIRDMSAVLAKMSPALRSLQQVIAEQETGISAPSINHFRSELQLKINQAIGLTAAISQDSQKLVAVTEQAAKHVVAIEEHFDNVLQGNKETANR